MWRQRRSSRAPRARRRLARRGCRSAPRARPAMTYPSRVLHWIGDEDAASPAGAWFDKRCPIDDRELAQVTRGTADDVRRAIDVAAAAAEAWGRMPAPRRGE